MSHNFMIFNAHRLHIETSEIFFLFLKHTLRCMRFFQYIWVYYRIYTESFRSCPGKNSFQIQIFRDTSNVWTTYVRGVQQKANSASINTIFHRLWQNHCLKQDTFLWTDIIFFLKLVSNEISYQLDKLEY